MNEPVYAAKVYERAVVGDVLYRAFYYRALVNGVEGRLPQYLALLFEDEHLLVVVKPEGLLTVSTETERF